MATATTRDLRSQELAWQVTLGISVLAAISLGLAGLRLRADFGPGPIVFLVSYIFVTLYYRLLKPDVVLARILIGFGQLVVVIMMGVMLSYAAAVLPLPYRDAELQAIDQWLGFERAAYLAFMREHDTWRKLLVIAYRSMMHQNLLVIAAVMIARRPDRLQAYVVAFAFAVTATAAIGIFVPAANAQIYVDQVPRDLVHLPNGGYSYFPALEALRAGTLRIINLGALDGLISFPSFHTANGILFIWAFWPIPVARYVILLLNVLLVAATPLCGSHYAIDIVGGAVEAIGAIYATQRLLNVAPAPHRALAQDADGRDEPGHGEIVGGLRPAE